MRNSDNKNKQFGGTDLMQYISEKWLKLLNYYYVVSMATFLVAYVYFAIQQNSLIVTDKDGFGLSSATVIFAAVGFLYYVLLFRLVRKNNLWLGYFIVFICFALAFNAASEAAIEHPSSIFFLIHNVLIAFMATSLGPIVAMAILGIIGIVYAMSIAGTIDATQLGLTGDGITILVRVVGVIMLLMLFKDRYHTAAPSKQNYIEHYFVKNEVVNLLTGSIGDGVIIIDSKQIVRSINPAALRLLGATEKDVLDLNYRSILKFRKLDNADLPAEEEPVATALKQRQTINKELILTVADKPALYIDISVSVIAEPSSQDEPYGAVIIIRDVSKKKQEEQEKSEFISTASHEMRTPIAAIEGYLGLALNERVSTIDERAKGYLQKAHDSTEHLGRLFQDLLMSSRVEDGRLNSRPQIIEIGELIEKEIETYRLAAQKKNLTLEFVTATGAGDTIKHNSLKTIKPLYYTKVDPDRIKEVFANLVENAIKYTNHGKITVGLTGDNNIVQFFVQDTGIGISQDDIPHLFQKFYRVDSSATRTTGGTGLGLFLCKKIIELYHGRIWVESRAGQGSTFYINLPRISTTQIQSMEAQQAIVTANNSATNHTSTN